MFDSFVTPWTVALQDLLSIGFSRQVYQTGFPFPFQGIFPSQGPDPELCLPNWQEDSLLLSHQTEFKHDETDEIWQGKTTNQCCNFILMQYKITN